MRRISILGLIASFVLGACSSTISTPPPVPATSPSPAGLTVATQRAEAQAGIAVAQGIQLASLLAAVIGQLPLGGGTLPTGKCEDGVESTIKVLNPEQLQVTIDAFYDKACATIFTRALMKTTYFPTGTLIIDGTSTTYGTNGKPLAFGTFTTNGTASKTGDHAVTTGTIAKTPTGPAQLSFGLSCTYATTNACGFGGIVPAASSQQSLGVAATLNGFTGSGTVKDGTTALMAYTGALGGLKLKQGSGNAWKIVGGTLAAKISGTYNESVDAPGLDVTGNLNLHDTAAAAAVTLDFGTRTGISNGVVNGTSPAKAYASFSASAVGTGAIDYSDGTTGQILFFIITS